MDHLPDHCDIMVKGFEFTGNPDTQHEEVEELERQLRRAFGVWVRNHQWQDFCGQLRQCRTQANLRHDARSCIVFVCFEHCQNHELIVRHMNRDLEYNGRRRTVDTSRNRAAHGPHDFHPLIPRINVEQQLEQTQELIAFQGERIETLEQTRTRIA